MSEKHQAIVIFNTRGGANRLFQILCEDPDEVRQVTREFAGDSNNRACAIEYEIVYETGPVYEEYIKSEEWMNRAKECKARALNRCQVCYADGQEVTLHAHHRTYDRLGNEWEQDLICLCKNCHALFHKRLPTPPPSPTFD